MVASASAIPARVWAAASGHFIAAQAAACSSQLIVAASGMAQEAGSGAEVQALAGSADEFGPVTIRQAPGDERPRPGPADRMPADLERAAAFRPAADRMDTHIKLERQPGGVHRRSLGERAGYPGCRTAGPGRCRRAPAALFLR